MNKNVVASRSTLSVQVHVALFGIFCVVLIGFAFSYPEFYTEVNIFTLIQVVVMSTIGFRLYRLLQSPKNLIMESEDAFLVCPSKNQEIRVPYSDIKRVEGDAEMNKSNPYPFGTLLIKTTTQSIVLRNVGKLRESILLIHDKMGKDAENCDFELIEGKKRVSLP